MTNVVNKQKKIVKGKLNFGFQIELKEVYFCKCYYFIFKGRKRDDGSNYLKSIRLSS